jgi:hypothetical protein
MSDMAEASTGTPAISIVRRGDDVLIRAAVTELTAERVQVRVTGDQLEIRLPASTMTVLREGRGVTQPPPPPTRERPAAKATGYGDVEPPISARDEQSLWNAQRPLISEDRRTSIHLEGFSDEQANQIVEALGDDASEEAQGGSATSADTFPEHGGFPERPTDETGEGASGWERDER